MQLALPAIMRKVQAHFLIAILRPFLVESRQGEGGYIFHLSRRASLITKHYPAANRLHTFIKLKMLRRPKPGYLITQPDLKLAPSVITRIRMRFIYHPKTRIGRPMRTAMVFLTVLSC
ncbi:hypothetical protein D3C78_1158910 [compost metagenome]